MKLVTNLSIILIFILNLFSAKLTAQHSLSGNFGVGPSYIHGESPYLVSSIDYKYHLKDHYGIGLMVGHGFNSEAPATGPQINRQYLHSLLIGLHLEYQYRIGVIYPYGGVTVGGSVIEREGFFLQPQLGARAWLSDHFTFDFSVRNPIWFKGLGTAGVTFNAGLLWTFGPDKAANR